MKYNSKTFYIHFHPQPGKSVSGFKMWWCLLGSTVCCPSVRMLVILPAVLCQHRVTGSARSTGVISLVETRTEHSWAALGVTQPLSWACFSSSSFVFPLSALPQSAALQFLNHVWQSLLPLLLHCMECNRRACSEVACCEVLLVFMK